MSEEIRAKRKEILEWEAANRNLKNRAEKPKGYCCYYLEGTPGCAIGRLLPEKLAKELSLRGGGAEGVFALLPPEIQKLGVDFLEAIQALHDCRYHFTNEGLTEVGHASVEDIRQRFCV